MLQMYPSFVLKMAGSEFEMHLLQLGRKIPGPQLSYPKDDFFTQAINHLQAISMSSSIFRDLYASHRGRKLGQNVVCEQ